ncbi:hypothetical protein ARALYDRAFT_891183 [Arabidopsis lyrata subsp. lyrata]|uniref:Uncharacterized protein n=1 Tax=Arabidopsis lyrata subsp. lyrata TaxID=81972 RepID=D7KL74_ARALL|nr:hypothetical protein ARALYDRAFT_891183 [Arabidopsis lyrata subsp. lyrata]
MESISMTDHVRVVRHNIRLPQSRYIFSLVISFIISFESLLSFISEYSILIYYFICRTDLNKEKEKPKEEAIQLGVELSLFVAEAMFLLSDDLRSTLHFCFNLPLEYCREERL